MRSGDVNTTHEDKARMEYARELLADVRERHAAAVENLADRWSDRADARARQGLSTVTQRACETELRALARRIREGLA